MIVSQKDRNILRALASQVVLIATLPVQQQTISLWKALNGLKPVRPMVMIDQIPWHEMDVDGELALQTEDDFCRRIETRLRRTLYAWKHIPVDMVGTRSFSPDPIRTDFSHTTAVRAQYNM